MSQEPATAHERWVAQNRAKVVSSVGEDRVTEWESVIADHQLPDGHVPQYMVVLLMEAAHSQGIAAERWRVLAITRAPREDVL